MEFNEIQRKNVIRAAFKSSHFVHQLCIYVKLIPERYEYRMLKSLLLLWIVLKRLIFQVLVVENNSIFISDLYLDNIGKRTSAMALDWGWMNRLPLNNHSFIVSDWVIFFTQLIASLYRAILRKLHLQTVRYKAVRLTSQSLYTHHD